MFVQYVFDNSSKDVAYKKVGARNIPYHKSDIVNTIVMACENNELHKGIIINSKDSMLIRFRDKKLDKILKVYFPKTNGVLIHNRDYVKILKQYVVSNNRLKFSNLFKIKDYVISNRKLILKKAIAGLAIGAAVTAVSIPAGLLILNIDNKILDAEYESYRYDEHFIKDMQHRGLLENSEIVITDDELKYYKSIFYGEEDSNHMEDENIETFDELSTYRTR